MDRSLALLAIGLFFGGGIGFVTAASQGVTLDGHDHSTAHGAASSDENAMHKHMHSQPVSVPDGPAAPTLKVALLKDPSSGWNLHVMTTGFRFAPENASKGHALGEGHAHVYINDAKIARLYGPWMHIDALPKGKVNVKVTLNTNDHRPIAVGGTLLSELTTVTTK